MSYNIIIPKPVQKQLKQLRRRKTMKVKYDKEADILIFILQDVPPVNAISEQGGVIISYDETGEPISIEFLNASQRQFINPEETALKIDR
jgi:uncharacterized protein YuzE